jgi:hypothetical protein
MSTSHSSRGPKKWILSLIVAFAIAFFALPKSAKACGGGGTYGGGSSGMGALVVVGTLAVSVAVTDVVLGAYDIGKGASGEHTSKGYAIFETSFAGAQTAAIGVVLASSGGNVQWTPATAAILALPAVLTLHGIVTLATVDWSAEKAREVTPVDPRAVPYGNVPYAPYAPPPPPPPAPQPETSSTHDAPSVAPEDRMRIRFVPTMIPTGTPGNVSMAPGIAAFGVF